MCLCDALIVIDQMANVEFVILGSVAFRGRLFHTPRKKACVVLKLYHDKSTVFYQYPIYIIPCFKLTHYCSSRDVGFGRLCCDIRHHSRMAFPYQRRLRSRQYVHYLSEHQVETRLAHLRWATALVPFHSRSNVLLLILGLVTTLGLLPAVTLLRLTNQSAVSSFALLVSFR